jgi:hypothetical protein
VQTGCLLLQNFAAAAVWLERTCMIVLHSYSPK